MGLKMKNISWEGPHIVHNNVPRQWIKKKIVELMFKSMPNYKIPVNLRSDDKNWAYDENILNVANISDNATQYQTTVYCKIKFSIRNIMTASI